MDSARAASSGLRRSLTLLRLFLVASALILLVGAVGLSSELTRTLETQAVSDEEGDVSTYANAVLSPLVVRREKLVVDVEALRESALTRLPGDVLSIKVWQPDGTLAFTTLEPERIGRRFPLSHSLSHVLQTGQPDGELERLPGGGDEHAAENRALGVERVLEVYAPIRNARGETVGVYEVYVRPDAVDAHVAAGKRHIWIAVTAVFAALYLALAVLVRGASHRLRSQNKMLVGHAAALAESFAQLERNALEMVETLNATVEAKDPYTAGHSQRVRTIAVAIAEELGLPAERVELLGVAALFHDVGKIGIPDQILTKPSRLTPEEFEVMKDHAAKGAEIVAKLSHLAGAVPIIRHHHERWDGRGYPDGLVGDEIPLDAAIVGLADAWDAMTTERPYACARPLAEALAEVRDGRGSQFSPLVADAFTAVAGRHGLTPSEARGRPVAAA